MCALLVQIGIVFSKVSQENLQWKEKSVHLNWFVCFITVWLCAKPQATTSCAFFSARNFDVWKTRVFAALDCKHLVGYVQKLDFDGISEEESDESASDVSDSDDEPKTKSSESFEVDSDAVDYDEERDVD
ncbi:hypothetical protein PF002_g752 [Phytophthora fragariae]|uniref:Uncharacterized protein n=1 Tax=Phytophthora fragariae TaxID=53985 RepID=A0A6A4AJ73_9STRA|nr:hypothetical protein PF002_g752 [Phytophthora fragariae]